MLRNKSKPKKEKKFTKIMVMEIFFNVTAVSEIKIS